jgi:hypothetical protein
VICLLGDILYPCRTQLQMVSNMLESVIETLKPNLWILAPALWTFFTVYIVWYITRAKHYAPITITEAKQLWSIHRQNTSCDSRKWRKIKHGKEIIGFQCECGYKHLQKRPLIASSPAVPVCWQTSFDGMQNSRKPS